MKFCAGCKTNYNNDVWLHGELKLCSKCFRKHIHNKELMWDIKKKQWIKREPQNKRKIQKSLECFFLKGMDL